MLDWNELNDPAHREMFEDVKAMVRIRRRETEILAVVPDNKEPNLMAVPYESDIPVPAPYLRWNDRGVVLVAANSNAGQDARLKLRIPLKEAGLSGHANYSVTELWPVGGRGTYSESSLREFACTVKRDRTQGGGLQVLKIEPNLG